MNYYTDVLKKYAVFDGRARRKEYWMFALFNFVIVLALGIIAGIIAVVSKNQIWIGIPYLYDLAVLIPGLSVGIRRLHDIGYSGWWFFIILIPIIGAIILFVFSVRDSQPGDNQYGPNPKGVPAMPVQVAQ